MELIGFQQGGRRIGAVRDGKVQDLGSAEDFYADWRAGVARTDGAVHDLADLVVEPAVPVTSRIFCVGINYRSHAGESKALAGLDEPKLPMVFGRWQQSLVTDGDPVPVPPNEPGLDWEAELAVVIGDTVWAATEQTAGSAVLGYAAFNDLSARRKQLETPQFTVGKNADRSGPISSVVTADAVPGIAEGLQLSTHVNGELMQEGNTRDLIHGVARIIAYLTDTLTLLPGDVIATGTPGGVGAGRTPPVFLGPGDEVVVTVAGVGRVRTPITAR